MTAFGESPLIVVSPHLDDGVFSCGDALARHPGSIVVTVFAGRPQSYGKVTEWDASAGFRDGDNVMAARRLEDEYALSLLSAQPCWLPFQDAQYGRPVDQDEIAGALCRAISRLDISTVLAPVGLFHSDHLLVHGASMRAAKTLGRCEWYLYADAIYRAFPGLLEKRLLDLRQGIFLEAVTGDCGTSTEKRPAVRAYCSQLRALAMPGHPGFDDAFRPESYWHIRRQREGRER